MAERPRVTFDTDLRRRRIPVLFRLPAALPAFAIVFVWSFFAAAAAVTAWTSALVAGRVPNRVHGFLRAYITYVAATSSWFHFVVRRYPRIRSRGPVAVDAERERQPRLITFARPVLALQGIVLSSTLLVVLGLTAVAAWFVGLARGRTTEGLRELGAFCVRYHVETLAFVLLVTPCAPRLAPPT